MMSQKIEAGGRHRSTSSSAAAASYGLFVKRLTLDPSYFVLGQDTVRIVDAWIERASRVKCPLVFGACGREPTEGYFEAFRIDRPRWPEMLTTRFVQADSIAYESRGGDRDSVVWFADGDQPLPDTLRLRLCEDKTDYQGKPVPDARPFLRDCPRR